MANLMQGAAGEKNRKLLAMLLKKKGIALRVTEPIPRRAIDSPCPLSFAQERLWFVEQMGEGGKRYNLVNALRLRGRLNVDAVRRSLEELIKRHEVLRTTFAMVDHEPRQIISPDVQVEMPVVALTAMEREEREAEAVRRVEEYASIAFDLKSGPLIHPAMVSLSEDEHIFVLSIHHIIADGWSFSVLVRELMALYPAFSQGLPSPLPDLAIQYADYACWQRALFQPEVLEEQLDYWRKQLSEVPFTIELPLDRPISALRTGKGGTYLFRIPEHTADAINAIARQHHTTLFVIVLSVWSILLHRYSGQDELLVGTPIANRNRVELESLIGFFVNMLALRTSLTGDPIFTEFLEQVRETTMAAQAHQDLPFDKVIAELHPDRVLQQTPLIQVTFTLQNTPPSELQIAEVKWEPFPHGTKTAKFDLSLTMRQQPGWLPTSFEYSADLFDESTIVRMSEHFLNLLTSVAAAPGVHLSHLRMLSEEEKRQMVVEWNGREIEVGEGCVHEMFEEEARRRPEAVAVVYGEGRLTYGELNRRANQLAWYLRSLGIERESRVAVYLKRSVDTLVCLLGILKAGGAYLPLDSTVPRERLAWMLEDGEAGVVLSQSGLLEQLPESGIAAINMEGGEEVWRGFSGSNPGLGVGHDQLAYVMYTSGSTGGPKGVGITHRGVVRLARARNYIGLGEDDVVLHFAPIAFDAATFEIWGALLNGGSVAVAEGELYSTKRLGEELQKHQVTTLWLTAGLFHQVVDDEVEILQGLRNLIAGGDVLWPQQVKRAREALVGCRIINGYGPTENTTFSCCGQVEDVSEQMRVSIGGPIDNTRVYVVDGGGGLAPVGVAGELYVGGAGLARGYMKRAELTAEKFVPDGFSGKRGERLYRTGDRVRWRKDGKLEFIGRMDNQVKIRGYRIELGEVETALLEEEGIGEAVVVVREEGGGGGEKSLVGYVVKKEGGREEQERGEGGAGAGVGGGMEEVRKKLRRRLPEYMIPVEIVELKEMPLTRNGKVDRKRLPEPERGNRSASYVGPGKVEEEMVCGIWEEVLKREVVGVEDNFFELGGHSLLGMQVMSRMRSVLGVEVPIRALFERPTVRGLVERMEEERRRGRGEEERIPKLEKRERREGEGLPMSFAQQRLWFLDRLEPGSSAYNIPLAVRLEGELKVEGVKWSIGEMVRRHEVLRTRFVEREGVGEQRIEEEGRVEVEEVEIKGRGGEEERREKEREVEREMAEEGRKGFDLERGPLVRVKLLRVGAEEHVLLVTMHHIISDGWSRGVMMKEFAVLYRGYVEGKGNELEELEIQYGDYAVWQREWLKGEMLEEEMGYWRKQLEGLEALELGLEGRERRGEREVWGKGGSVKYELGEEMTWRLKEASRKRGVTLFMMLLGGWQLLLSRYSGQEDVAVGTPIAGRRWKETEKLIGFFVNTLVMRSRVRGAGSVEEFLGRVKETALEAYGHQDVPFEKLVEELNPERGSGRTPLFQAMFTLGKWEEREGEIGLVGVKAREAGVGVEVAKFDLSLGAVEKQGKMGVVVTYRAELFERSSMERLVRHWEKLLGGMVEEGSRAVEELGMLSEEEKRQVLVEWNRTEQSYGEKTVVEMFEEQARRNPEAAAVRYEGERLSYGELNRRSNQLAHYLRRCGVERETRVGLCMERSLEMVVGILAVLKAGGAYVPLDPEYPVERLQWMVEDSGVMVVLTQERLAGRLPAGWMQVISVDGEWERMEKEEVAGYASQIIAAENAAYVMYTSGSTGRPKGVVISHGAIANHMKWMEQTFPSESGERILQKTAFSFDASVWEFYAPLLTGGCLVMAVAGGQRDKQYLLEALEREEITMLQLVPTQLQMLLEGGGLEACRRLKRVYCGGEALKAEQVREFYQQMPWAELYNLYGPTEATIDATCWQCREQERVSIGGPIDNTRVYVVDGGGGLAPVGVAGELYVGGAGLARGYMKRAELTAEKFVPDGFSGKRGERLYRTGDRVRWRKDGKLEFIGRMDNQVKIRGYRIELGEVETALLEEEGIGEAVVVVREEGGGGGEKSLVGYVVKKEGGREEQERGEGGAGAGVGGGMEEVRKKLRRRLPEYMIPVEIVELKEMPLTRNGKVDRKRLPEPERGNRSASYVGPGKVEEEMVCGIWEEVLKREVVGVEDNFFELGGHSLLGMQVMSRMRSVLGVEVPIRALFERPTVRGLVERMEEERRRGRGEEERIPKLEKRERREGEGLPMSFAQQRLWFLDRLEPGSSAYNIPLAVRLEGELKVEGVKWSIGEMVRRHEVLRTRFVEREGVGEQRIEEEGRVEVEEVEIKGRGGEEERREKEREVEREMAEEGRKGFDLERGPLVRVKLLRVGAEEHVLLVTMHHIISDGWSRGVMMKEFAVLYRGYVEGKGNELEELEIQYGDYAVWQREWLKGEMLEEEMGYWRKQLEGLEALELGLEGRERRGEREVWGKGGSVKYELGEEMTWRLKEASRKRGVTLFMMLLGGWQLLLSRYSGQEDVAVGTPIAGRRWKETEKLIGFFVNTLVMRSRVRGAGSVEEFLGRVKETALEAYGHQDVPFEKLVEELNPERGSGRTPLFQAMFTLGKWEEREGEIGLVGVKAREAGVGVEVAKFDLSLGAVEKQGKMGVVVTYRAELFERSSMERLVRHWEKLLGGMVEEGSRAVEELGMLSEEEKRQVLVEWNRTEQSYGEKTVVEMFEEQARRNPEAAAVRYEGERLSYGELNRRSNQLAHYLRRCGVERETRVGLCMERSLEMVVGILAVLKAGGAYVPLDPEYPVERLQWMVEDSGVMVVLTQERLAGRLPAGWMQVISVDGEWERMEKEEVAGYASQIIAAENAAYVMYTSGSTGRPKGVVISHGAIANHMKWMEQTFPSESGERILQKTAFSFDASVWEFYAPLLTGGCLVMAVAGGQRDKQYLLEALEREEITMLQLVPTQLQMLLEGGGLEACRRLKRVYCGGEALKAEQVREFYQQMPWAELYNLYGPTEATIDATCWQCREQERVSIGGPIDNTRVYVVDGGGGLAPVGVAGELYVGGAGLARGYMKRAELTAEKFVPDGFSGKRGERLYRTGDRVRWRKDGKLEFIGRMDNQVKIRGYRIELGEVETALLEEEGIGEAVVVVREEGGGGGEKSLVGYVVKKEGGREEQERGEGGAGAGVGGGMEEVRKKLRRRLPEYMIPVEIVELKEMPLTRNGKVDRKRLPEPERGNRSASYVGPGKVEEEMVCGIWEEVLKREVVGVEDNFFELGGHSLLGMQVMSRMRSVLGVEVPIRALFERPTVRGLVERMEEERRRGRGEEERIPKLEKRERREGEGLPMSFAQQRLWFLDRLEPGSSAYNIPLAVRLEGELKVEGVKWSIGEMVRRHEVLRTRFVEREGVGEQRIEEEGRVEVEEVEIKGRGGEEERREKEREVEREMAEEGRKGFDLERGPLVRVKLLRVGAEEHVLLVTMHHIISDGWSRGVMMKEFAVLYRGYVEGKGNELEELEIQYGDYAVWQREWLKGEMLEEEMGYWRKQLEGLEALELGLEGRERRGEREVWGKGGSVKYELGEEMTWRLKEASRKRGVTLFMMLLGGWQLLLSRYSGQEDVAVGTPIAGRRWKETEKLIGFFVNTLVMRSRVRGAGSVEEFLGRVKETALEAYGHQDVPFEKLVEELNPERGSGRTPLFQAMFTLGKWEEREGEIGLVGVKAREAGVGVEVAKFDLSLGAVEKQGKMGVVVTYRAELFERSSMERLVRHWEKLLGGMVEEGSRAVEELGMLSEEEKRQVLVEWNRTEQSYGEKTVVEMFEEQARRRPEAVAVVYGEGRLTYGELNRRANQLAHYLRKRGVGVEDVIGIALERSLEMVIAILGIMKAGGAYLPLDPELPASRLKFMLEDAQARAVFVGEREVLEAGFSSGVRQIKIQEERSAIEMGSVENPGGRIDGDNMAYVIYTSGSTGKPKGVAESHSALRNLVSWHRRQFGLRAEDRVSQMANPSFDAAVWELWPALTVGGCVEMAEEHARLAPERFQEWVRERKITMSFLPTPLAAEYLRLPGGESGELRWLLTGGDQLRKGSAEGLGFVLVNNYGPTECAVVVSSGVVEPGGQQERTPGIGGPIDNTRVYVVDGGGGLAPVGVAGELYVGGAGLARGYMKRAELTAEKFVPDGFSGKRGERLYRTGDRVRWRKDGKLEFIGRMDNQVKIRGYRIELGEVETALLEEEGIGEAVVVVREEGGGGGEKSLVGYVVKKEGGREEQERGEGGAGAGAGGGMEEVRKKLRRRLPEYMIPVEIVELKEMPLTRNGKVDRKRLPEPERGNRSASYVGPGKVEEEMVCGIWEEVLKREVVGVEDNFFELGGHSLLGMQVMSRMRSVLGVEVPIRALFERPTVRGLVERMEEERRRGRGEEERIPKLEKRERREGEGLPMSFAQQRLWFLDRLEPGSSAYNIPLAVRLEGELKVEGVKWSIGEMVRRHEVLRTRFVEREGVGEQRIEEEGRVEVEEVEIKGRGGEEERREKEREVEREMAEEGRKGFDLERGPLVRVKLLRVGAEEHVLLVTMHHIISDGWSRGVMMKEFAVLYRGYVEGKGNELEELEIQYGDYAVWQREWLKGEMLEEEMGYWRKQLEGLEALELGLEGRERRGEREVWGKGGSVKYELGEEMTWRLKEASRKRGVTLFMMLLGGWQLLLSRYSGQEDVAVGTPIAGRRWKETEKLIGFFVNTLVMRSRVRGAGSVEEFLGRVKETALEAYGHQDVPFEKLVEELNPERGSGRTPLFQAMFTLGKWEEREGEIGLVGVKAREAGVGVEVAKFDLSLGAVEKQGKMGVVVTYRAELFERSSMERLVRHWEKLLGGMVEEGSRAVEELGMLSEEEKRQMVEEWNGREIEVGEGCVHEMFEEEARRRPEAVAVVYGEGRLTYGELNRRANQLAWYLRKLGVKPEIRVGICTERSLEMMVGILAVLKAGGAYIPMDPAYPLERLQFMLQDSAPALLLTEDHLQDRLSSIWHEMVMLDLGNDAAWKQQPQNNLERDEVGLSFDHLAYVIYTSGSTGQPKGVMIQHRSLSHYLCWCDAANYQLDGDGSPAVHSIGFDGLITTLFGPLVAGQKLTLLPRGTEMECLAELFSSGNLTYTLLKVTPSHLKLLNQMIAADGNRAPTAALMIGGEALIPSDVLFWQQRFPQVRLVNHYGPTEITVGCCTFKITEPINEKRSIPIGGPIDNTRVYVVDGGGGLAPVGVAGELYVGGAGLARGYMKRAELTAEKFVPDGFSGKRGERLYRTGDRVRWRKDGKLEFIGRMDNQVKIRGYRIELGEVETALLEEEGIGEAVVVVREEGGGGGEKSLVGYVVKKEGGREEQERGEGGAGAGAGGGMEEVRKKLRRRLPEYMIPVEIVELKEMPLTRNGKVDRKRLPEPERGNRSASYVGPGKVEEEMVCGIWEEVLKREVVGVEDNFFELGGHSLLGMQVMSRMRSVLGVEVPIRALFERPTVRGLVERMEEERRRGRGEEERIPKLEKRERREGEGLPMSFAQQRLWFLDRLEPGSSAYNIPLAVRLEGELKVEGVKWSIGEMVRRHEVLRTRFVEREGVGEQRIEEEGRVEVEEVEIKGRGGEEERREKEREVEREMAEEGRKGFDLERGPLVRVKLLRVGAEEHVLLVTMHHIISDGWSRGVMMKEFAVLYRGYVEGKGNELEELEIQYGDYAVWQREWLKGEMLEEEMGYWRKQLEGLEALELGLEGRERRGEREVWGKGGSVKYELGEEMTWRLKEASRKRGVTLFMMLLGGWQLLLSRYSGQEDVAVGTPIAGRRWKETEKLIGFFVNTLVMRSRVRGAGSVEEFLGRVKETALEAYGHQDVPFEKLVEELNPERGSGRTPLFQAMFTLGKWEEREGEIGLVGVKAREAGVGVEVAKFDLSLGAVEKQGKMGVVVTYRAELFERSSMERLVRHWEKLLGGMVEEGSRAVEELGMLSEEEKRQVLVEWNGREIEVGEGCVHEMFEEEARRRPEAVAVVYGEGRLTYGELNRRANQLAWYLRSLGIERESRVAVYLKRSVDTLVCLLGILKAGGAYLPLDSTVPRERLAWMLEDGEAGVVLSQSGLLEQLPESGIAAINMEGGEEVWRGFSGSNPGLGVGHDQLAYVMYTSGSTGGPKGVGITHRGVVRLARARNYIGLGEDDVVLHFAPIAFDAATFEIWGALLNGGSVAVAEGELYSTKRLGEELQKHQVTTLWLTAGLFHQVVDDEVEILQGLRNLIAGGDVLWPQQVKRAREALVGCRIINGYGPTENTTFSCCGQVEDVSEQMRVSIGGPIDNTRVYVVDGGGGLAPVGVAGELYVGGAGLARGYMKRAELTAEKFVPDGFSGKRGERLYRTGDRVRWRKDGKLEFIGRMDNQVKIRGYRIELGEVETALLEEEGIGEAVVVVREEGGGGGEKSLVGYVVKKEGGREEQERGEGGAGAGVGGGMEEVRKKLRRRLPEYMIPVEIVELKEMPLTRNGKVDRKRLPEPERGNRSASYVGPGTPTEEVLCKIWKDIFNGRQIGINDNFFELGGHSLLLIRLISLLKKHFGREVSVARLFESPTIGEIAAFLDSSETASNHSQLVRIKAGSSAGTTLYFIHPAGGSITCYFEIAHHLAPDKPLCAVQGPLPPAKIAVGASIEEIAAKYLKMIEQHRGGGCYQLGGWSFGGLVAFEMARQAEQSGHGPEMLCLLDPTPLEGIRSRINEKDLIFFFINDVIRLSGGSHKKWSVLGRQCESIQEGLELALRLGILPSEFPNADLERTFGIMRQHISAVQDYRPDKYEGRSILIQAKGRSAEWTDRLGSNTETAVLDGDHYSIMRGSHAKHIAKLIQDCR